MFIAEYISLVMAEAPDNTVVNFDIGVGCIGFDEEILVVNADSTNRIRFSLKKTIPKEQMQ